MSLLRIIFSFGLLFFIFLFVPKYSYAAFEGGINIGDHYSEIGQAVSAVGDNGWIYVLMRPENEPLVLLKNWLNNYPNINFIVRGHYPDIPLTTEYANKWAQGLNDIPKPIYFVPVNEPNNPAESSSGIPAQIVVNYINSLKTAGLFNNPNVRVLSPAIDVYSMVDRDDYLNSSNYAKQLNSLSPNFFSQFYGLALNLYGEYLNDELNTQAKDVKKGDYKQFISEYMGITGSPRIFIVETGVKEVEDQGVEYGPNRILIIDYLDKMSRLWGGDVNAEMFAIFSYDPDPNQNPNGSSWIYTDNDVLNAMGLSASSDEVEPTIAPPSAGTNSVIDMYNITKRSNTRLLPQSIQEKIIATECKGGIDIPIIGCLFGTLEPVTYQNIDTGDLAGETQNFQPVYVPSTKIVNAERECGIDNCAISNLFQAIIAPQMANKPSGSLNAYRPSQLNFSNSQTLGIQDSPVLAESTNPEQETINSYNFTMKMLLPASIGGVYADIPAVESPTPVPTGEVPPLPSISVTPQPPGPPGEQYIPPGMICYTGIGYCSVEYLMNYFPDRISAEKASVICHAESRSQYDNNNLGCLTGRSRDYSIGLFQINLLAHCGERNEVMEYTWDPIWCKVKDQVKHDQCFARFSDPINNINYAVELSSNGKKWVKAWSTAKVCGVTDN